MFWPSYRIYINQLFYIYIPYSPTNDRTYSMNNKKYIFSSMGIFHVLEPCLQLKYFWYDNIDRYNVWWQPPVFRFLFYNNLLFNMNRLLFPIILVLVFFFYLEISPVTKVMMTINPIFFLFYIVFSISVVFHTCCLRLSYIL